MEKQSSKAVTDTPGGRNTKTCLLNPKRYTDSKFYVTMAYITVKS